MHSSVEAVEGVAPVTLPTVMVVSSVLAIQQAVADVLSKCGLSTIVTSTVDEAHSILGSDSVSLIFCSDELSGGVEHFIQQIALKPKRVPIIVVLRVGEWERFISFLDFGALDCVVYPLSVFEIKRITENALSLAGPRKAHERNVHKESAGVA